MTADREVFMKDILLVNMFSKNESSYTDYYIEELEKAGLTYESIYFERYDMDAEAGENELLFKEYCPTGGSKVKKLGIMSRYARFVRNTIQKGNYKGIMVFTTVPAIMISDLLIGRYAKRYLFDIRDYTHENIGLYYQIEEMLIRNAFATVISSRGFLKWLPAGDYVVTHNVARTDPSDYPAKALNTDNCRIGYVGSIRYYEPNIQLLNQFRNRDRYHLDYYGTFAKGCDLEAYCRANDIQNVSFFGRYNNDDKKEIYRNIDVINSVYGIQSLETSTLMPHRLYDAAIYKCPIIVSKNSYLAEVVEKYGLGFAADEETESIPELLDDYLETYDADTFAGNCERFLNDVAEDMQRQKDVIRVFIKKMQQ